MPAWKRYLILMLDYRNKGFECDILRWNYKSFFGISYYDNKEDNEVILVGKIQPRTAFLMTITCCLGCDETSGSRLRSNVTIKDFELLDWYEKQSRRK